MNLRSKRGTSALQHVQNRNCDLLADRLSSLPDELLIRILSLLPTKDAAAACLLSRRMRDVFRWITTLDFDDSPISHCLSGPLLIHRFPTFLTFVHNVLQSYQSQNLTRFRLRVGPDFITRYFQSCKPGTGGCDNKCFPDLKSAQINAWISFPLTRLGLRELDLRIQVSQPGDNELPSSIFLCETLEVLKLDVNLGVNLVCSMPSFHLPNLKLLQLRASLIPEDGFLPRLVSSCPLLEDLTAEAWWNNVHSTSISSPSLRRLCLRMHKLDVDGNTDLVRFHTPNLEYLEYYDNLALHYSVSNMPRLIKADIAIGNDLLGEIFEVSSQQMISFIKPLSKVQHLSLLGSCTEDLNFLEIKEQLPEFPALKLLDLGYNGASYWDKVLLAFLNCSPVLETLVFSQGLIGVIEGNDDEEDVEFEREQEFCRTSQAIIPVCCRLHLKTIVIKYYCGKQREVDLIQFLLKHALVLEKLVICRSQSPIADQMTLETTLKDLPRASVACSIQVH